MTVLRQFMGMMLVLAVAVPVPAAAQTLSEALAQADAAKGETVFKRCKACHTVEQGGAHKTGPNLWGVIGRAVATAEGYTKYSKAMLAYGGEWTPERLDHYLIKPKAAVPGTRMTFVGLSKEKDRLNLLAYLNQFSTEPLVFGADAEMAEAETPAGEAPEESAEAEEAEAMDIGLMVPGAGAEETYAYCTACHSEMIVVQQGKTRAHWDDLLEWMVEEQGMSEIEEPDRSLVLDYLAEYYNEDRPNFPGR